MGNTSVKVDFTMMYQHDTPPVMGGCHGGHFLINDIYDMSWGYVKVKYLNDIST